MPNSSAAKSSGWPRLTICGAFRQRRALRAFRASRSLPVIRTSICSRRSRRHLQNQIRRLMANDIAIIDRFLDIFSRYIDSGFGLISGDVGFLVKILIGIDVVVAALAWVAGEDEVIQAFAKKILYVGFFAFILNSWNALAQVIFNSFAALGLRYGQKLVTA